jgi:hypothetical protein
MSEERPISPSWLLVRSSWVKLKRLFKVTLLSMLLLISREVSPWRSLISTSVSLFLVRLSFLVADSDLIRIDVGRFLDVGLGSVVDVLGGEAAEVACEVIVSSDKLC